LDDIDGPISSYDEEVVLTPVVPQPVVPRVWTVFATAVGAVGIAIVLQIIFATVLVAVEAARGGDIQQIAEDLPGKLATTEVFIPLASAGQLAFLIGALVPAWLSPVPIRERLGLVRPLPSWNIVPMVMIGSWASVGLGTALASWLALYIEPSPFFEELYENVTLSEAIPFVMFMALVPGICEELLFRGYIQRRLLQRWSPLVAITVTSALFALVHMQLHHVIAVFPMGLWLGVVAWKTGSVIASMFCHAFINGTAVAWDLTVNLGDVNDARSLDAQLIALALGLIYFAACVLRFRRMDADRDTTAVMSSEIEPRL
jgi:membrane protease YdiL (CAAX protease family)